MRLAPDGITAVLRSHSDHWKVISHLNDDRAAQLIRADRIDILVDLSQHTADNRLLIFARKPAPIQVTWQGYPGTTGLSTIDYRLTDPYLDPHGQTDEFYTERSIRLPHTFWCYQPTIDTPQANALPALKNGYITFGCFNSFVKVTEPALRLWAEVLKAVPDSRLLLQTRQGTHRQRIRKLIEGNGIASERLEFVDRTSQKEYFGLHHRVDIALDPIPYPGHTTALDGFWMGVPVITLAGTTAASRGGVSMLNNVGLPELIAYTKEQYVSIAAALSADLDKLSELRATLRERMRRSPLMDARQFARDIEAAYRKIWINWCTETTQ
jgi:predicted O-linked N-acetylglucosamine transferase (SPINDLY family)